jgi:glycerol-1-phosphate dehydrogenase [NAD(P)+]
MTPASSPADGSAHVGPEAVDERLAHADPTRLDELHELIRAADPESRLHPVAMRRVEIAPDALELLPDAVGQMCSDGGRVVMVMDATPMERGAQDLKPMAAALLAGRFDLEVVVIGAGREQLHADEEGLEEVRRAVEGADCAVVVGSGTMTDLAKEGTHLAGSVPLVAVQTAASVNAFSDDMAVLLKDGAKRTVHSRYPDVLLIDLATLADAPPAMNLGGFGDLIATWTAPADWYLSNAVGFDTTYHPAPVAIIREGCRELLEDAARLRERDPEALQRLARVLTLSGFTMGFAGVTAPCSGTEHLISHLIDMDADQRHRPLAFHGAQVAVAALPAGVAWHAFLKEFDPGEVDLGACFPADADVEPLVRAAFARIDPSGRVGSECWRDVAVKLERWRHCRDAFAAFLDRWPTERETLRAMLQPPALLADALGTAGAPTRFSELDPPADAETVRWALRTVPLMRNRFTLGDVLFFTGRWDEQYVERLLAEASAIGGGL